MVSLSTTEFIEVIIYTLAIVGAVIINCFLFLRSKKIVLVQYFFRVQVLVGFWIVAKIFKLISLDQDIMWFWVLVEYFGICFFGVELVVFGYIYKYNKLLSNKIYNILGGIAFFSYIALCTNPFHHLFFKEVLKIHSVKGPLFYFHMSYSYTLIILAIILISTSKANKLFTKKDMIILFLSLSIPLLVNINYVTNTIKLEFDLTPIIFNIIILIFGITAFRNNYFDVQMMTRLKILDNLYEGIIILDKDNRIIEYNKKAIEIISPITVIKKYNRFGNVFINLEYYIKDFGKVVNVYIDFIKSSIGKTKTDVELTFNGKTSNYLLSLQKTYSVQGEFTGTVVKFVDMTEYHELMHELEIKNKKLQTINSTLNENISVKKRLIVEQECNRASKEVHDILGHSVTLVISLLEMIKATYKKEPNFAKEKVLQAMEITRNGLKELKQSLTKKKDSSINTETLIEDLEKLIGEFTLSGVEVEFITNHYPMRINPKYYDTVYRICQESMTNALRHGNATKITIAVRFSEHSADIIIADNGKGCCEVVKGNGIKGMEQRVKELDGFFSCGSPDGEGFNLHVTLPLVRELSNINNIETIQ